MHGSETHRPRELARINSVLSPATHAVCNTECKIWW